MEEKISDKEFLEYIVRTISSHPEDVVVERKVDEMGVLLTLSINPEDMGYIIGKQGQTAKAIRTLLKIIGAKSNARINLKIVEPEGSRRSRETAPTTEAVDTDVVDDLKI